jgi:hypothetical protein
MKIRRREKQHFTPVAGCAIVTRILNLELAAWSGRYAAMA